MSRMDPKLEAFLAMIDKNTFQTEPFVKKVEKPWGYELLFTQENSPYTGKVMHIQAGKRISLQIHDQKIETQILVNGKATIVLENSRGELEEISMQPFVGYTNTPGQKHRVVAIEDCDVFEASLPETGNTYRLEDDYTRPTETEAMRQDPNRGYDPTKQQ